MMRRVIANHKLEFIECTKDGSNTIELNMTGGEIRLALAFSDRGSAVPRKWESGVSTFSVQYLTRTSSAVTRAVALFL